ncbi:hypothetical protein ANCDUO_16728, partial [Ancylostoma duodenale]
LFQGRVALNALKKHFADRSGKSLFPDIDHAVGLADVYKTPPLTTDRARVKIELPCPPRTTSNTSICLILPDLDQSAKARKDPDVDKQARQWAEKIEKDHGLLSQHYSKILTKRQLEREYHTFTQRRALATSYDLFLVDVRVGKAVRTFLGKDFYKAHKEPLDFNYSKPLVSAIEKSIKTVVLKLPRYATRAYISIGHLGQDSADLASNLDELAVRKNGKVRVISEDSNTAVHYPTVHDEWEERDGLKPTIDPAKLKRKHAIKKKRLQKRVSQRKIKSGEKVTVRPENHLKAE